MAFSHSKTRLSVVERSFIPITSETLEILQQQYSFKKLLNANILYLQLGGSGNWQLRASHFLGSATLENGWEIEVEEKAEGTVQGLFNALSKARYRVPTTKTAATLEGHFFIGILTNFIENVKAYVAHGRRREYESRVEISARPRGKLNFAQTIRQHASGRVSVLATQRQYLTADIFPNQVLAACLTMAEIIALKSVSAKEYLNETRQLFLVFRDTTYHSLLSYSSNRKSTLLSEYLSRPEISLSLRTALEAAFPLFVGGGLFKDEQVAAQTQSLFVDMEYLFEESIRTYLSALHANIQVVDGNSSGVYLFPKNTAAYECTPDLVLKVNNADVIVIGDVKYKNAPPVTKLHDDVYQLLAHCHAYNVKRGFMVFPDTDYRHVSLGITASGVTIDCYYIRPSHMEEDLKNILKNFSFLVEEAK